MMSRFSILKWLYATNLLNFFRFKMTLRFSLFFFGLVKMLEIKSPLDLLQTEIAPFLSNDVTSRLIASFSSSLKEIGDTKFSLPKGGL